MSDIYISLGSNVNRAHHIKCGLNAIATAFDLPLEQLQLSSLFESIAVGFDGKPFYNMVVGLSCQHTVAQVAIILREIEYQYGRSIDAKKFSPRTLDLDLLLFDDLILDSPAQIPRDEINKNAFVLWPLSQVAPTVTHPILQQNYQTLWQAYDKSSQQLTIVEPCW